MVAIKGFTPRLYQETIFAGAIMANTMAVLPTGMGKSMIFLMLSSYRLKLYPESKIIILAPTKPLCEQHVQSCRAYLDIEPDSVVLFTGHVKPEKRSALFDSARIIVSTPQGLENDIINRKISFNDVSLIVFDECHRAVGDYSYVWIAEQYEKTARYPRILALTASPGTDMETIGEVIKNLHIEHIELKTEDDPDVKPYIQDVKITWVKVKLNEDFRQTMKYLNDCYKSKLTELKKYGYISDDAVKNGSKKELLGLQAALHGELASGNKDFDILKSISLAAEAMKVQHGIELIETQGIASLVKYLDKIIIDARTTKTKATKNLAADFNFRSAWIKAKALHEKGVLHPKMPALAEMVSSAIEKDSSAKLIVFNQYRDNAEHVVEMLNGIPNVNAKLFVGQQKKGTTGMSQKEQIAMLSDFRNGKFNVLVSTSVAEEGLDIPKVDGVIFYEPVPSAIRHIQRRGRTGRLEKGEVRILIAEGTRDEGYRWSAHHKEKRMYRTIDTIRNKMGIFVNDMKKERKEAEVKKEQKRLSNYESDINDSASGNGHGSDDGRHGSDNDSGPYNVSDNRGERLSDIGSLRKSLIIIDHREKGSKVIKELIELGDEVSLEVLESADFLVSERVGVEFKTKEDFVNSIIDGRLLEQAKNLKNSFERPLIIVEGKEDIYSIRKIHPRAIQGMISTIAVGFGIPIIYTSDYEETASILSLIARREQSGDGRAFSSHSSGKPMNIKESQEYIVSSLPYIGPVLAKDMLKSFGSVSAVLNATEEELMKIDKLGPKRAKHVRDILESKYQSD